jgi:Tfp pilus assembly protein FimV
MVGLASQALAETAAAPASAMTTPAAANSYKPKASESLDQVIAKTLPGSPLKIELLRQAFMAQNPQAIIAGKVPKLRKGVTLVVPDHDQLIQRTLGLLAPASEPTQPSISARSSTFEERKRWVQYP